jgi:hypothetical protein
MNVGFLVPERLTGARFTWARLLGRTRRVGLAVVRRVALVRLLVLEAARLAGLAPVRRLDFARLSDLALSRLVALVRLFCFAALPLVVVFLAFLAMATTFLSSGSGRGRDRPS